MLPLTLAAATTFAAASLVAGLKPQPSEAMPPFAQAVGQNCSLCHTMVPALNSYGRYILRSFYSGIGSDTFHGTSPVWLNENLTDRSTGKLDSTNPNHKITSANVSADVAGLGGHWSYRVEQTLWSNDQSGGGLGNAWVGYNEIFGGDGHVRVGKFSRPVPSVFSNNWYRTGFSAPSVTVGNHAFSLSGSGWGGEFSYAHGNIAAEAGVFEQANNLPNAASFTTLPGTQRSVSWQVAYANPNRPLEVGIYSSVGTFTQTTAPGAVDIFNGTGLYVQRDAQPKTGFPGLALIYQLTADSNPGLVGKLQRPPGNSHAAAFQIEEPLFHGGAMLGARRELTNSLGTVAKGSVVDFGFQVPHVPYLFGYSEATMGSYSTATFGHPTWRFALRWAGPIRGPVSRIK
jgi:hypothetical protein